VHAQATPPFGTFFGADMKEISYEMRQRALADKLEIEVLVSRAERARSPQLPRTRRCEQVTGL
jgi:hypothetical protein